MIVVRFRIRCRSEQADAVREALAAVVAPSRALEGVMSFDIGRDLVDPDVFIATEVFENRAALDRQESLDEVGAALTVLGDSLAGPPEATIYHVSSAEPHGA